MENLFGFITDLGDVITTDTLEQAMKAKANMQSHDKVKCSNIQHRNTNMELMKFLNHEASRVNMV